MGLYTRGITATDNNLGPVSSISLLFMSIASLRLRLHRTASSVHAFRFDQHCRNHMSMYIPCPGSTLVLPSADTQQALPQSPRMVVFSGQYAPSGLLSDMTQRCKISLQRQSGPLASGMRFTKQDFTSYMLEI